MDHSEPIKLRTWRLRSPMVQNMIASICLAMTPGIYLGILGAGAGKSASSVVNSKVNVIVYAIFFFVSICAGPLINVLGPKICLAFGTTGYAMYVGGLWYIDVFNKPGFPLFTGAYLGVTAGFLWTACAYTSQAYGEERKKAWYVQFQLICMSTGSAIACALALGVNYHKTKAGGVSHGVYGAFIAIHLLAGLIALLLIVDPKTVRRDDGTHLAVFPRPSPKAELLGMWEALRQPRIMFFIFAGFAFDLWLPPLGSWNAYTFGLRARGLNGLCFYILNIVGGFILFGCATCPWVKKRKNRAYLMLVYVLIVNVAAFGAWIWYLNLTKPNRAHPGPALDWTMGAKWSKPFAVYLVMGLMSTSLRNFAYWANAVATNDPTKQARYAGLMHAMPQAGLCIAFGVETTKPKFITQAIPYLAITLLSIACCFVGVKYYMPETLYGLEEGVIVPVAAAEKLGLPAGDEPTGYAEEEDTSVSKEKDGVTTSAVAAVNEGR